ncbi:MAG TPA: CBS domain-containing protein [Chitinophagaceae bacterium]|nr:CBS domain-containing protein [Chitinophagaceae bacterium]
MKVSDILKAKGNNVYSVTGDITVYEALKIMGERNVGALLVIEDGHLKGIISERDYARKIILKGKLSRETLVKEIMTEKVITVLPEDNIEKCMGLMSGRKIRHLPVMKDDKVLGIVSITDVVTAIIEMQKDTIAQLENYISQ